MKSAEEAGFAATSDSALVIANRIAEVCQGERTVPVYMALSMMIGHMAAQPEVPDFEATMKLVAEGALESFREERQRIQIPPNSGSEGAA